MSAVLLKNFAHRGVLPRSATKNYLRELTHLLKTGLVRKARKRGRVFYELTSSALELLEERRQQLRAEAKLRRALYPRRAAWYTALLEDLRFLNTSHPETSDFLFLGDWRLDTTVTHSQLLLSQFRYYESQGLTKDAQP